jgi:hypothetical protein
VSKGDVAVALHSVDSRRPVGFDLNPARTLLNSCGPYDSDPESAGRRIGGSAVRPWPGPRAGSKIVLIWSEGPVQKLGGEWVKVGAALAGPGEEPSLAGHWQQPPAPPLLWCLSAGNDFHVDLHGHPHQGVHCLSHLILAVRS